MKLEKEKSVIGSNQPIQRLSRNLGFLETILICYNHHWILKTSPEDWLNIIGYTVATAIDKKSKLSSIRKFFVNHNGEKEIKTFPPVKGFVLRVSLQLQIILVTL